MPLSTSHVWHKGWSTCANTKRLLLTTLQSCQALITGTLYQLLCGQEYQPLTLLTLMAKHSLPSTQLRT